VARFRREEEVAKTTQRLVAVGGLVGVMVAGTAGLTAVRHDHASALAPLRADDPVGSTVAAWSSAPPQSTRSDAQVSDPGALSSAFRAAAQRAMPAVVYVQVERWGQANPTRGYRNSPNPPLRQGSGSGFIFRSDGYILTNNHVIDGAERVTVVLQDRREFEAEVVGRDPDTDVAVIRIRAQDLPVVPIGSSDAIQVGDWVVALGYPLSLGSTATAGIVSAKGRSLDILRHNSEAQAPLEQFIQTDAAINPGNSGGPLIDLKGEAVGISSAIASPTGFFSGYGFAVPIGIARRVAEDLIRYGEPHRPRLGVQVQDVDAVDVEVYRLPAIAGAEITQVTPGLPAERAGMKLGDVVVGIEGTAIASGGDLTERLAQFQPGQRVRLDVVRYGERMDINVELGAFEPSARTANVARPQVRTGAARLGFAAAQVTPELARVHSLPEGAGVMVSNVDAASGAVAAGLRPGMVIDNVNGRAIRNLDDLEAAVRDLRPGAAVSVIARQSDDIPTIINFRVRG
jgi:serine protease Do